MAPLRNMCLLLFHPEKKLENVNAASAYYSSMIQRPMTKLNSDKFRFHVHLNLCTMIK